MPPEGRLLTGLPGSLEFMTFVGNSRQRQLIWRVDVASVRPVEGRSSQSAFRKLSGRRQPLGRVLN